MPQGRAADNQQTSAPTSDYNEADYPPFAVTVDLVILTIRNDRLHVLLVQRDETPFEGQWALPGGFVRIDEGLQTAARRELAEETSVSEPELYLEQLGTYGEPNRDPRMRVVSVAWLALAADLPNPAGGTDARDARWVATNAVPRNDLAFDHALILADGLERARAKLEYSTLAAEFCGATFTISELRAIYEAVWDAEIDPRNFNRKVLASKDFVTETGDRTNRGGGRPAKLFAAGTAADVHPPLRRGQFQ
jgi:8-oxo-dGTP diphosphatase